MAEKLNDDTILFHSLINLVAALQNQGRYKMRLPSVERAEAIFRKNKHKAQLMESLDFKVTLYAGIKQTDKALPFTQEALILTQEV